MTDAEMPAFLDVFRRLTRVFPFRGDAQEVADVGASYFKAFRRRSLPDVVAGADRWIQTENRFPRAAQWLGAIPRGDVEVVPMMSEADAREHRRAELLGYEDAPCQCDLCRAAEVDEKPLRFVPEFTENDRDKHVRDPLNQRVVTAGHWAHGVELFRWYRARGDFWNRCYELGLMGPTESEEKRAKVPLLERLEKIFETRKMPNVKMPPATTDEPCA